MREYSAPGSESPLINPFLPRQTFWLVSLGRGREGYEMLCLATCPSPHFLCLGLCLAWAGIGSLSQQKSRRLAQRNFQSSWSRSFLLHVFPRVCVMQQTLLLATHHSLPYNSTLLKDSIQRLRLGGKLSVKKQWKRKWLTNEIFQLVGTFCPMYLTLIIVRKESIILIFKKQKVLGGTSVIFIRNLLGLTPETKLQPHVPRITL